MSDVFDRMIRGNKGPAASEEHSAREHPLRNQPGGHSAGASAEDRPQTTPEVRKATQELLKNGYLEESEKPELFRSVIVHESKIAATLEPLDLELRSDTHRGVAFLVVAKTAYPAAGDDDAWNHPLVRRQRLTLEQSLLVAILRQTFIMHEQESGVGQSAAKTAVDDLLPQFMTYFGDSGSDAKNESRLLNLLDQLKPHGIVSEVDKNQEVTVRPLIAYLANPDSLAALLKALKAQMQAGGERGD